MIQQISKCNWWLIVKKKKLQITITVTFCCSQNGWRVNANGNDANRPSQFRSIVFSSVVFHPPVHLNTLLHHHIPNGYLVCCWHLKQCQEMASILIAAICLDRLLCCFRWLHSCNTAPTVCNNLRLCSAPYWLRDDVSNTCCKEFNKLISFSFLCTSMTVHVLRLYLLEKAFTNKCYTYILTEICHLPVWAS